MYYIFHSIHTDEQMRRCGQIHHDWQYKSSMHPFWVEWIQASVPWSQSGARLSKYVCHLDAIYLLLVIHVFLNNKISHFIFVCLNMKWRKHRPFYFDIKMGRSHKAMMANWLCIRAQHCTWNACGCEDSATPNGTSATNIAFIQRAGPPMRNATHSWNIVWAFTMQLKRTRVSLRAPHHHDTSILWKFLSR